MKKIIVIALVLISSMTFAQQKSDFQKDAEKLVSIVSEGTSNMMIKQFKNFVSEDKQKAFTEEITITLPSLYSKIAKIYMEEFTHNEIKEMLKFYETPVGKKMASKSGVLAEKGMKAGQEWGMSLQEILKKYQ
ncbi:MAG: hypothetical protein CSA94_02525 [Bacteroidetes bacterium]|nr:MAG: hypothetical protein CSA94_02525 [Bacteroidota bacterium]